MDAGSFGLLALWGSVAALTLATVARFLIPSKEGATGTLLGLGALFAAASTVSLVVALLVGDFSLEYVVRTTSLATPWPYRLAGLWGAMEGSLLFYATLTIAIGWAATRRLPGDQGVTSAQVVALIGLGLVLLTAVAASPFTVLDVPAVDGEGLLAILQHPAMVYHPPILYSGLTVLVVPFAVTVAAVLARRTDGAWIELTRRWLLVSWTLLAVGMVAGANWAYVELGWGGFWAWDPVENTSLMPWLAGTVYLHVSRVQERDRRLTRWTVAFALLPFVLTLLGVYLTRSGSTGSIHAFAESPVIGRILLVTAAVGVVFAVWVTVRSDKGEAWERVSFLGRDTWLAVSGGLVAVALIFVAVGSAYPAYLQVFLDQTAMIRPAFFVAALAPIALVLAPGIGLAFNTAWRPKPISTLRIGGYFGLAVLAALAAATLLQGTIWLARALLGLSAAAATMLTIDLARRRPSGRILAGHIAHLGMALVLFGVAGSALGADFIGPMGPGETARVGDYAIRLGQIETGEAGRFIFVEAEVVLTRDGETPIRLTPQIRAYEEQALPVPEPALYSSVREDVVVAISRVAGDASVVEVSVLVRPLVFWVWAGSLLIVLAGLVALGGTGVAGARRRLSAREEQRPEGAATSH